MGLSITKGTLGKTILGLGLITSMVLPFNHASAPVSAAPAAAAYPPLVVSDQQTGTWIRNFNIFMPQSVLDPTKAGIYEPLWLTPVGNPSKAYPWLATSYSWSKDLKTLTWTIRQGVKWSDGQPLTADDVYYTIMLGKTCAVCDQGGFWGASGLASSVTESGNTVSITFKSVNTANFGSLWDAVYIVPKHIWSKVTNPSSWTNPNPVGSGPFTQVTNFSSESYDINANPYYWQPLAVKTIRYIDHTGNDATLLDFKAGKIDWGGHFFPDIQDTLLKVGPQFQMAYSYASTPAMLYVNDQQYPFSLPALRQAISMSIDREALANSAEYGYTIPSSGTGLDALYPNWVDHSLDAQSKQLTTYSAANAKALLLKSGFKYSGTSLMDPKGKPVSTDCTTVIGWTDWDAACTIMAQNLTDIGIDAGTHFVSFGTYTQLLNNGNFTTAVSWVDKGSTPYTMYYDMMDSANYFPINTQVAFARNLERYKNPAVDPLFTQFSTTADLPTQQAAMDKIEQIFLNDMPVIPLWYANIWGEFSTANYTGFPTLKNFYASSQTADTPDRLLVFTKVKPSHS